MSILHGAGLQNSPVLISRSVSAASGVIPSRGNVPSPGTSKVLTVPVPEMEPMASAKAVSSKLRFPIATGAECARLENRNISSAIDILFRILIVPLDYRAQWLTMRSYH